MGNSHTYLNTKKEGFVTCTIEFIFNATFGYTPNWTLKERENSPDIPTVNLFLIPIPTLKIPCISYIHLSLLDMKTSVIFFETVIFHAYEPSSWELSFISFKLLIGISLNITESLTCDKYVQHVAHLHNVMQYAET
jgi:hypothetical protein